MPLHKYDAGRIVSGCAFLGFGLPGRVPSPQLPASQQIAGQARIVDTGLLLISCEINTRVAGL